MDGVGHLADIARPMTLARSVANDHAEKSQILLLARLVGLLF
jgi:hypothetical protein